MSALIDLEGVRRGDAYLDEAKRLHGATERHPRPVPLEEITTMNEETLSTDEAAEILGMNPQTVRRWCREGILPCVKMGRGYRIARPALARWWRARGGGELFFTDPTDDLEATDD